MLQKNAISEVPPETVVFYSNTCMFLVHKTSGGRRSVIHLKKSMHATHFLVLTVSSVLSDVSRGFTFIIDLGGKYFHKPIHPGGQKYLLLHAYVTW